MSTLPKDRQPAKNIPLRELLPPYPPIRRTHAKAGRNVNPQRVCLKTKKPLKWLRDVGVRTRHPDESGC